MSAEGIELRGQRFDWPDLLNEALDTPGGGLDIYSRFHSYSFTNSLLLRLQGATEPCASYQRWKSMGRQVMKGEKGLAIIRPIFLKRETLDGDEVAFTRFKVVNGAFQYGQTDGPEIEMPTAPDWELDRALEKLEIKREPWNAVEGNAQGASYDRTIRINPAAAYPLKTALHECGHILCGHTTGDNMAEYRRHRGTYEYEAESTAFLAGKELDVLDEGAAAVSRAYVQGWLQGERPEDRSIRKVFKAASELLRAGRVEVVEVEG